jgi:hypothetical protein
VHKADMPTPSWRKSSFSEAGNCVEVAELGERVLIRDTKLPAGSVVLSFPLPKWREFISVMNHRR